MQKLVSFARNCLICQQQQQNFGQNVIYFCLQFIKFVVANFSTVVSCFVFRIAEAQLDVTFPRKRHFRWLRHLYILISKFRKQILHLVKRIIGIMCAKNCENTFTFWGKRILFPDTVYIASSSYSRRCSCLLHAISRTKCGLYITALRALHVRPHVDNKTTFHSTDCSFYLQQNNSCFIRCTV